MHVAKNSCIRREFPAYLKQSIVTFLSRVEFVIMNTSQRVLGLSVLRDRGDNPFSVIQFD